MHRREIDTRTREPGDSAKTTAGKALAVTLGPLVLAMLALAALSWAFTDSASPQSPRPTGEPLAQVPSGDSSLSPPNNDAQDLSTYKFKDPMRQLIEPPTQGGGGTTPTAPTSGSTATSGGSGGQGGGGGFEDDLRDRGGDRFGDDQGGQSGGRGGNDDGSGDDDGPRRGPGGMTSLPDSGGISPGWLK